MFLHLYRSLFLFAEINKMSNQQTQQQQEFILPRLTRSISDWAIELEAPSIDTLKERLLL